MSEVVANNQVLTVMPETFELIQTGKAVMHNGIVYAKGNAKGIIEHADHFDNVEEIERAGKVAVQVVGDKVVEFVGDAIQSTSGKFTSFLKSLDKKDWKNISMVVGGTIVAVGAGYYVYKKFIKKNEDKTNNEVVVILPEAGINKTGSLEEALYIEEDYTPSQLMN